MFRNFPFKKLIPLNPNKAEGPDGISNADLLATAVTDTINTLIKKPSFVLMEICKYYTNT